MNGHKLKALQLEDSIFLGEPQLHLERIILRHFYSNKLTQIARSLKAQVDISLYPLSWVLK